jgi:DNA-binding response OmpR family regulator
MVYPRTILVIDDDPDIRADVQMLLEDEGYRVLTAPDGHSGLQRVSSERPDLVIVDMMMPKMSGFIVLERIKQHADKSVPVIMLTANGSDQQRAFAEFLGVDAYLSKPVTFGQLLENLRRLCPTPASPLLATPVPLETVA